MDTSKKISATKVIDAPAEAVFAVLADPNRHTDSTAGAWSRDPREDAPARRHRSVFTMNMHQDALGDYRMINTVTAFVPEARIGWGPSMDPACDAAKNFEGVDVSGHTYTWDLRESDGRTEVTETYEWTGVKDPQFEKLFPLVSEEDLARSLDKLAAAVS